jgi:predicted membrane chloride channel (bestrophin family)
LTVYETFIVVAYLENSLPERSLMCLVVAFMHTLQLAGGEQPEFKFARLDITHSDFENLGKPSRRDKDQILHWMTDVAYQRRSDRS